MLSKFSIALFLNSRFKSYPKLLAYARTIKAGMLSMTSTYPAPNPDVATTFSDQIDALSVAITAWGERRNHGSTADKETLKAAADAVRISLTQLREYVMNVTPNDTESWTAAKFIIKRAPSPVGPLAPVENLKQDASDKIPAFFIRLKWRRPLGSERARNIKYKVLRNSTNDPATASWFAVSSKTSYQYQPPTADGDFYWIVPINSDGSDGAISNFIFANPKKVA